MKRAAALLLLFLALACEQQREPQPEPEKTAQAAPAPAVDPERGNLLLLSRGTTAAWRNAEVNLLGSALHAGDGDTGTAWQSPFGGSVLFVLPARSRIHRVGVSAQPSGSAQTVRFTATLDGTTWRDVATFAMKPGGDAQMRDVPPFEARELRVDVEEAQKGLTILPSLYAYGEELEAATAPSLDGCWSINGQPSGFTQRGSNLTGTIGNPPMTVTGSSDGRAFRVQWRKGAMWGSALLAATPRSDALSAVVWHQDLTDSKSIANAWFGKRVPCR